MKIICDTCGKTFGTSPKIKPGEPEGMGFVMEDGVLNMCYNCICILGGEASPKQEKLFKKINAALKAKKTQN